VGRAKTPHLYVAEDRGYKTPCWVWTRALNSAGYAVVREGHRLRLGHVVFYEREYGSVPPGLQLDHLCRITACVRPDHLEAVTHAENIRRAPRRRAKLTAAAVAAIWEARGAPVAELARRFGVSSRTVYYVLAGDRWST